MIQRYYKHDGAEGFIKNVIDGKLSVNFNLISNDSDHFNDTEKALKLFLRSAVFE